jgi:hypothetical protein
VFSFGDVEAAAYFMLDDGIGLLLGRPLIESCSCRPMGQGKPHAGHYDSSHANPSTIGFVLGCTVCLVSGQNYETGASHFAQPILCHLYM